jgi:hypothetical protein
MHAGIHPATAIARRSNHRIRSIAAKRFTMDGYFPALEMLSMIDCG